jgi:hypothetical protein
LEKLTPTYGRYDFVGWGDRREPQQNQEDQKLLGLEKLTPTYG